VSPVYSVHLLSSPNILYFPELSKPVEPGLTQYQPGFLESDGSLYLAAHLYLPVPKSTLKYSTSPCAYL
jgi:hypothetical protein